MQYGTCMCIAQYTVSQIIALTGLPCIIHLHVPTCDLCREGYVGQCKVL